MIKNLSMSLYIANLSLLATHQMDAAFWHEWELFGIPRGLPLFLVLSFLLMAIFLHGFHQLIVGRVSGHRYAIVLGAAGIVAFGFHGVYLALGRAEFSPPISIAVLVLTLMVSIAQILISVMEMKGIANREIGTEVNDNEQGHLA